MAKKLDRTKKIFRCFECKKITRKEDIFDAELVQQVEMSGTIINPGPIAVQMCRGCMINAGYKLKGKKSGVENILS